MRRLHLKCEICRPAICECQLYSSPFSGSAARGSVPFQTETVVCLSHRGNGFLIRHHDRRWQGAVQFGLSKEETNRLSGGEADFRGDRFRDLLLLNFFQEGQAGRFGGNGFEGVPGLQLLLILDGLYPACEGHRQ